MPDLTDGDIANSDFGSYTEDQFFDDMFRVTQFRTDPMLVEMLVKKSLASLQWMREQGVRFQTSHGRQAYKVDGRFKFWGGLACEVWGGGPGLVEMLMSSANKKGIKILFETTATGLLYEEGTCGVTFTFGGLKITENAQVENTESKPIPGLYAAGEIVGGLFYHNYPGGSGLTAGAVFGKVAGEQAALGARYK